MKGGTSSKRGALIAASLPNNSVRYKRDLQDKFYEQVDSAQLITEEGLEIVKTWLKKELGEEDLYKCVRVWEELEECKRKASETIEEFLDRYPEVKRLSSRFNEDETPNNGNLNGEREPKLCSLSDVLYFT